MPSLPPGEVIYAVGDIHGRLDLLSVLAEHIGYQIASSSADTTVVLLGDYVDRGPDSSGVLEWLVRARDQPFKVQPLLGNHESLLLQALQTGLCPSPWLRFGGMDTLRSYGVALDDLAGDPELPRVAAERLQSVLPARHRDLLDHLPLYLRCADYLFVHAGVRRGRALSAQEPQDLLWRRPQDGDEVPYFGLTVVHGHTPSLAPASSKGAINVDTGAYATSRLSCVRLEASNQTFFSAVCQPSGPAVVEVKSIAYRAGEGPLFTTRPRRRPRLGERT